ncbi:MAG TPA: hypothetical protein VFS55_15160 [Dokdonella sp.]|nr:hypothetical protein [Dokdonella sp.]
MTGIAPRVPLRDEQTSVFIEAGAVALALSLDPTRRTAAPLLL